MAFWWVCLSMYIIKGDLLFGTTCFREGWSATWTILSSCIRCPHISQRIPMPLVEPSPTYSTTGHWTARSPGVASRVWPLYDYFHTEPDIYVKIELRQTCICICSTRLSIVGPGFKEVCASVVGWELTHWQLNIKPENIGGIYWKNQCTMNICIYRESYTSLESLWDTLHEGRGILAIGPMLACINYTLLAWRHHFDTCQLIRCPAWTYLRWNLKLYHCLVW